MTPLVFTITGARPAPDTAAPAIDFRLCIEREVSDGRAFKPGIDRVHALALRCQVRIEPRGRRYTAEEQARLYELFGEPSQWHRNLTAVTWAHTSVVVPSFERVTEVDLRVPCTYDLEVASAKYLHAIRDGDIPIGVQFSGTVFTSGDHGLVVEPVRWDREASLRLPASVWHKTMQRFFPGGGWVRLDRETIDRLQAFRGRRAAATWDRAIALLLEETEARQTL